MGRGIYSQGAKQNPVAFYVQDSEHLKVRLNRKRWRHTRASVTNPDRIVICICVTRLKLTIKLRVKFLNDLLMGGGRAIDQRELSRPRHKSLLFLYRLRLSTVQNLQSLHNLLVAIFVASVGREAAFYASCSSGINA